MGKKILLADDSITIQKVIELTFSDEDFDVVTVGNGRLAIEKVQEARPDVVLCDIIMPEKDGYEVCEFIKKNPALSHVPVLLLTGAFEPFDQERAARAGCDGFLAKPFEPQTLIAKVKDLLSQAVARPAPAAAAPAPVPAPAFVAPPPPAPPPVVFTPAPVPPTPAPPVTFTAPPPSFTPPRPSFTPPPSTFAPAAAFTPTPGSAYTPPATAGAPPTSMAFGTTLPQEPPAPPPAMPEPAMTYVAEESSAEEAPLGFVDVMDTVPAPAETFDEPELEAAAFAAPAEETAPEDDLLDVSAEERAALEPPPLQVPPEPADSSSTVMFQATSAIAWTPPALDVPPLPERAEEPAQAIGEASMFEEVFEEDLSAVPPLQAAAPHAAAPAVAEAAFEEPAPLEQPLPAPAAAVAEESEPSLSDALAAEAAPPPSEAAEVAVPVDQVAQIAQRVVGQISEKVIREIAWEVIPDLAEALIRKEIERLKAELQQS